MRGTVEERFWDKVEITDSCWLWVAGKNPQGYGRFRVGGKKQQAHRFSYERYARKIPPGLEIDHLCRVRNCIRPSHLEPVTGQVNCLRGTSPAAFHAKKTHCPKGHPYSKENIIYLKNRRGKLRRGCKACVSIHAKERYKARRAEYRERYKAYYEKNKKEIQALRKMKKLGLSHGL